MVRKIPNPITVKTLFFLALFFLNGSCSQKALHVTHLPYSLKKVRQAVRYALVGGLRNKSSNNRVYFSKYHPVGGQLSQNPQTSERRAQVVISILGDQRPYTLKVVYRVEEYSNGQFRLVSYDKDLAQKYLDYIREFLSSRPDDINFIDQFRPY